MSQPPPYNRQFSFTNYQAGSPTSPPPGSAIDGELNNVKASLDGLRANSALIQRDDGALKNGSVTFDTLSPALQTAGIAPALPWVTATSYSVNANVTHGSAFYRCLVPHTSGVFATDLAAARWVLVLDFSTIALVAAAMIAVTPSGSLTSDAQTSLQALDTGKAPTSHTHPSSAISDSTAAGRALLTAATVAAQQSLLGLASLGFAPGDVKETANPVLPTGWYYCDGSAKNRGTDAALFGAITIQQSGTVTNGSAVITGLADTSNMSGGMFLSGSGIQAASRIQSVDNATQVTMTLTATATSTTTLVIAPYGVGDGSTTFNLPNRAYAGVGRDNASGIASNLTQVSTTLGLTNASASATVGSATGLVPGMVIAHPKVPVGTTISVISGTAITMSAAATGTVSSTGRFSSLGDAQTLGAVGGTLTQSTTLVTANLPAYTPAGTIITTTTGTFPVQGFAQTGTQVAGAVSLGSNNGGGFTLPITATSASAFTGTAQGGTSAPILQQTFQPTIVMNYIIKR